MTRSMQWARTSLASLLLAVGASAGVPAFAQPPEPAPAVSALEATPGVNINTATEEELMRLPGIGARKAEAIVARRDKKKFVRAEELMDIKGIGRGIFKRCKPFVRVAGITTLAMKVTAGSKKG